VDGNPADTDGARALSMQPKIGRLMMARQRGSNVRSNCVRWLNTCNAVPRTKGTSPAQQYRHQEHKRLLCRNQHNVRKDDSSTQTDAENKRNGDQPKERKKANHRPGSTFLPSSTRPRSTPGVLCGCLPTGSRYPHSGRQRCLAGEVERSMPEER
jgi:hypothetical protein